MQQNRWKAVNEIFHAALEVPPNERADFLFRASEGDSDLRLEVERMLLADAKADGYLESLTELDDTFGSFSLIQSGDLLKERFRIRQLLGEGGMGQVFEAWDEELKIRVALKVIRPEIVESAVMRASFRREVRIARAITHPNVCRIYDMERAVVASGARNQEEMLFLTMEFLQGETLAARITRTGPIPLSEALAYARQIASALDAAHAVGIVHRDIKPANMMLIGAGPADPPRTRVVITDFGLARAEVPRSDLHGSSGSLGVPAGTVAYMAPEQMEPHSEVTAATDVYAFGLVLFEMVTGKRAFPSANLLTGIAQRLSGPPPSPRSLNPELPETWESAIRRCLRRDPSERFRSASEVMRALDDDLYLPESPVSSEPPAVSEPRPSRWHLLPHRRALTIMPVFVVAVSLFAGWLRFYQQRADPKVSAGALVYLAPVQNRTGERELNNLNELLKASLGQSAQIKLLDQGRVGDTLQLMTRPADAPIDASTAREIAMRTGAVRVLFATVSRAGASYELEVDIQQTDSTPSRVRGEWKKSFAWDAEAKTDGAAASGTAPAPLLRAVREAGDWIRARAGESANDIARLDVPPEDVTTGNWEALSAYSDAEVMQARQRTAEAIIALERAVALDPHFSLAFGRLGDLQFSSGRYEEGLRSYRNALEPDQDRRLDRRERDRILGEFALDTGDYAAAERSYRDLTLYYDHDYTGWSYRGYPLLMLGRTDEAIHTLTKAYSLDPSRANAPWELARANIAIGDFPEALRWSEVLKQQGSPETYSYIQAVVALLKHDYSSAETLFRAMQTSEKAVIRSWSYELLARLAAGQGEYGRAIDFLDAGIAFDKQYGQRALEAQKLTAEAYVLALDGQYVDCMRAVDSSLDLETSPQRLMVSSAVLGVAYRRAPRTLLPELRGRLELLQRRVPSESFGPVSEMARYRVRGEILLATGRARDAVREFRKASELDAFANGREYLARALETVAETESDPQVAGSTRQASLDEYAKAALRPNLQWFDSIDVLPGYFTMQVAQYRHLKEMLPGTGKQTSAPIQQGHPQ